MDLQKVGLICHLTHNILFLIVLEYLFIISQIISVDLVHVESRASEMTKSDKNTQLILGQLIDKWVFFSLNIVAMLFKII